LRADVAAGRGADPDAGVAATVALRLGGLQFDVHEQSGANSLLAPSSPRATVTAAGRPGFGAGIDFEFAAPIPRTPLRVRLDGRLDLGIASLDDAALFGEPPLRGRARFLDGALGLGAMWPLGAWRPVLALRVAALDLAVDWELAFGAPPPTPEVAAHFGLRWAARAVAGCEWREGRLAARLEVSLGAWARDWQVALAVARAF
jgi:hypothetical protein